LIKKYYNYTILLLFGLVLFGLNSCYKDIDQSKIIDTRIPGPDIVEQYDGNLTVRVEDLNGNVIKDVQVFVYNESETTGKDGLAIFNSIPLDRTGTHIKALKEGFLYGSTIFNPTEINNFATVQVLPILNLTSFDSQSSVSVEIIGGGSIEIDAGSLEYYDGSPFNGEAYALSRHLDQLDPKFNALLPGDHTGLASNGSLKNLEFESIIHFSAYDENDNPLRLKEGEKATIFTPIDQNLIDFVLDESTSWFFHEGQQTWVENGKSFKEGDNLMIEINQLGFWASGLPTNFHNLGTTILSSDGLPLSHMIVQLFHNFSVASAMTDGEGKIYTKIPSGKSLSIQVKHPSCNEPLYEANLESHANDAVLDDIIINTNDVSPSTYFANCFGTPIQNAVIYIQSEYNSYQVQTNDEGIADFLPSEAICNQEVVMTIYAEDKQGENESVVIQKPNSELNSLNLDVCADCDFDIEIESTILDYCDLLVELTVSAENGSGDYSYQWEDSSIGSSVTVTTGSQFCVTVTDNVTECSITGCKSFIAPEELVSNIAQLTNIDCQNYGAIELSLTGGTLPYYYNWVGPNGFQSDLPSVNDILDAGIYSYTVTDVNGCETEGDELIEDLSSNFALNVYTDDMNNVICDTDVKNLFVDCDGCGYDLIDVQWLLPGGSNEYGEEIIANEAGIYTVILELNNCTAEGSIQLQKATFTEPELELMCDDNGYLAEVSNLEIGFSLEWPDLNSDVLLTQFSSVSTGNYVINSPYTSCEKSFEYVLPIFNGFTVEANHTSCDSCDDGSFTINIDEDECVDCIFDNYYIYGEGDFITDLKEQNDQETLTAGLYHIVAKSDSGCILNSLNVIIE